MWCLFLTFFLPSRNRFWMKNLIGPSSKANFQIFWSLLELPQTDNLASSTSQTLETINSLEGSKLFSTRATKTLIHCQKYRTLLKIPNQFTQLRRICSKWLPTRPIHNLRITSSLRNDSYLLNSEVIITCKRTNKQTALTIVRCSNKRKKEDSNIINQPKIKWKRW